MSTWTEDEDRFLIDRWVKGDSALIIARAFHFERGIRRTRNSVIGRLSRLGYGRQQKPSDPTMWRTAMPPRAGVQRAPRPPRAPSVARKINKPPHPGPQGRPAVVHGKATGVDFKASPEEAEVRRAEFRRTGHEMNAFVAAGAGVESPNARPFLEAKGGCKWPLGQRGEVRLCCNPVERGAYCAGHAAVAYVPHTQALGSRRSWRADSPSGIEVRAVWFTRFDRIDHYEGGRRKPSAKPAATIWDEGRDAA